MGLLDTLLFPNSWGYDYPTGESATLKTPYNSSNTYTNLSQPSAIPSTPTSTKPFIGPIYNGPIKQENPISPTLSGNVLGTNTNVDQQRQSEEDAARAAYEAALSSENTQFDYNREELNRQMGVAGREKSGALSSLEGALGKVQTRVGEQKQKSGELTGEAIGQAGSTARNTQRVNRNVLRALGILNSSYAADKLQQPINQFDVERGRLNKLNIENVNELDRFEREQLSSHQEAVKDVESQYGDLVGRIQQDLRFNDRQRLDAVKAANAALQQRLAEISQSMINWKMAIDTQKQQFLSYANTVSMNQTPSASLSGITGTNIASPVNQNYTQTVGIADDQKKKTAFSSNPQYSTLSGLG